MPVSSHCFPVRARRVFDEDLKTVLEVVQRESQALSGADVAYRGLVNASHVESQHERSKPSAIISHRHDSGSRLLSTQVDLHVACP